MTFSWYRDLYRIDSVQGVQAVLLRMGLAVGIPMVACVLLGHPGAAVAGGATAQFITLSDIGQSARTRLGTMFAAWVMILAGGTLGHMLGDTHYSGEFVVLACALLAGWASGSHPGVAAVTRFFAIAAAAGTGMHFTDPDILGSVVGGGVTAFAAAFFVWRYFGLPPQENVMDWRAGVRRAFQGADAGIRFACCYAGAAAVALFAASALGVNDPYWATLAVLMVMRREGVVSLELTIHYAFGTIVGVAAGAAILHFVHEPLTLAILATLAATFARVGFSINPCLGYMSFTMFLPFGMHLSATSAIPPHLFETRVYDVSVGCALALAATLLATYPRGTPTSAPHRSP
jgi:hypothetical protein